MSNPTNHYLDAKAFTALFADRDANRPAIGRDLLKLATHVAGRLAWATDDDRDDAVADAAHHCVRNLGKFRHGPGANAFAYFTSVAYNQLRKSHTAAQRHRSRFVAESDYAADGDGCHGNSIYDARKSAQRSHRIGRAAGVGGGNGGNDYVAT